MQHIDLTDNADLIMLTSMKEKCGKIQKNRDKQNLKLRLSLDFLVAGEGLEPSTFGL